MTPASTRPRTRTGGGRGRSAASRRRPSPLRRVAPWLGGAVALVALLLITRAGGDGGESESGERAASFVGGDLHSLVADPTRPERLFVGGHEAVASSTDRGRTWVQVASLRNADAMGWAFLDGDVWMGGHPGLRRSTDGGGTFQPAGGELASTDVHALGGGDGVLYAASPGRGLLASTDDGRSWQLRSGEAGRGFMGVMVVDPEDPDHLVAPDMQAGVVESTDGGRTWRRLGSPGMAMSVTAVDGDLTKLIVAGAGEAARSDDGGSTWRPIDVPEGTMVVSAGRPGTLHAASLDGGTATVAGSTDGGVTWQRLN